MRIATFFLFLGLFLQVQAQMKQPDPTVFIFVGDSIFPMNTITSQTELKKGWDIQGINVGRKIKRYFWGRRQDKPPVANLNLPSTPKRRI